MPWTITRDAHVAVVAMNSHPMNAQNERFFADLHDAFARLERDFADCAVVLTSAARVFSAGLDFDASFEVLASRDADAITRWFEGYRATNLRIFAYPRPTVAAMNGHAFAGGLITALDCDVRVCVEGARLGLNEVPIGIPMPAAYVEIIRHAVGTPAAARLTLGGVEIDAREALRLGVVHAVAPPDELLARALAEARRVAPPSFDAYAFSKRALQAPAMERIEGAARAHDARIAEIAGADANVRARARRYEEITGRAPRWARG